MDLWTLANLETPWALHVVGTLKVGEQLEAGPMEAVALARAVGAHPESLTRVMRHLVAKGVFEEANKGHFSLNDTARGLLHPAFKFGLDLDGFGGRMAYAWQTMLQAVRTGKPAYHEVFGRRYWED